LFLTKQVIAKLVPKKLILENILLAESLGRQTSIPDIKSIFKELFNTSIPQIILKNFSWNLIQVYPFPENSLRNAIAKLNGNYIFPITPQKFSNISKLYSKTFSKIIFDFILPSEMELEYSNLNPSTNQNFY